MIEHLIGPKSTAAQNLDLIDKCLKAAEDKRKQCKQLELNCKYPEESTGNQIESGVAFEFARTLIADTSFQPGLKSRSKYNGDPAENLIGLKRYLSQMKEMCLDSARDITNGVCDPNFLSI